MCFDCYGVLVPHCENIKATCGAQNRCRNWSDVVLNPHLDPISDQNDVRYLSTFAKTIILYIFDISDTVLTNGTYTRYLVCRYSARYTKHSSYDI